MGSYFPPPVLTNMDLEKRGDTCDEWISTRTDIKDRGVSEKMSQPRSLLLKLLQKL
jgi:3-oxoacyl-[acyl-carrier-protein] synthase III